MSKIYKAIIYLDDINDMYSGIDDIKNCIENGCDDLTTTFKDIEEYDTTEYINKVEDNYPWNTTDDDQRAIEMDKYINKINKLNRD